MNPQKERRYINITFFVAFIIVISINVFIYRFIRKHVEDSRNDMSTMITIQTSEKLLSAITEAETNRRGYLITSNQDFLDEYTMAVSKTDSIYNSLKELTRERINIKEIVDSLGPVIMNRQDILEESIRLQEKKLKGFKDQVKFSEVGKRTQDIIRDMIKRIQEIEQKQVRYSMQEADEHASITFQYVIAGTIVSGVLMLIGIFLLNRKIIERLRFEKALERSRNWFSTTLMSIGDAVIVTDKFGAISFMNHIAEQLTEWNEN